MTDFPPETDTLTDEDRKLIVLARAARARTQATAAAAVRDDTGRTYVGVDVDLPSVQISATALAVAQAVAAGAAGLEAAAIVGDWFDDMELDPLSDLGGSGVPVMFADPAGHLSGIALT